MKIGIMSYCFFVAVGMLAVFGVLRLYGMQWSWVFMPLVLLAAAIPAAALGAAASEHKRGNDDLKRDGLK